MKQDDPQVEQLKAEVERLTIGWQRTQADFANFQRRTEAEYADLRSQCAALTLLELTPILDNFERAFKHLPAEQATWTDGFRHIAKQIEQLLADHELAAIETVGQPFDPSQHEAIAQATSPTHAEGIVIEQIERGFSYKGKVVRPAKVVVSTGIESAKKSDKTAR